MKKIFLMLSLLLAGIITRTLAQTPGYAMSSAINAGTYTASGSFAGANNSATGGFTNNYGNAANDVWYKFIISGSTAASSVQISLCESNFNTYLHVLNSGGTEIYSNNDNGPFCNPSTRSSIAISNLAPGTYYAVVEGYQSDAGFIDFSLNVTIPVAGQMTVIYNTPPVFTTGTAIAPLSPTVTGGTPSAAGQTTVTLAGTGLQSYGDGPGNQAYFDTPIGTAVDAAGNVYVADCENEVIRKITPLGNVSTFAGQVNVKGSSDAGMGTFNHPAGLAVDATGTVYVADQMNHKIRKITPAGSVSTLAGFGTAGFQDGAPASAYFNNPTGVCVDGSGNVYVADFSNHRIRKVTPTGNVSTFAGNSTPGSGGGVGTAASFRNPIGVAIDASGNIWVADRLNYQIRKITPTGQVTTIAGTGSAGSADNLTNGMLAGFDPPNGVAVDPVSGDIFVADPNNNKIRRVTPTGSVSTFAGSPTAGSTNGTGSVARYYKPYGLSIDSKGNIYVADNFNQSIRKLIRQAYTISPALPAGLTFNETTGVISGTPTAESAATVYTITAYNATTTGATTITLQVVNNNLMLSDENYIVSYINKDENISTATQLTAALNDKDKVQIDVQYFDGLGRPMQLVQVKGNPDGTKDIVQPIEYDQYGREVKKYLPFAYNGGQKGSYKTDASIQQITFYNPTGSSGTQQTNGITRTNAPFAITVPEPSPLNRVQEQGFAGESWQPNSTRGTTGRTLLTVYTTNDQTAFNATTPITNNPGSRKVNLYTVSAASTLLRTTTATYADNQLSVTITKNENWLPADGCLNTVEEYKDKEGRIVLKRTYNKKSATALEMLSTYYVYDDLGNLRSVLPPGDSFTAGPDLATSVPTSTWMAGYAYRYAYDSRNRLTQKKLPGKGWEYMVYNKLDQVVATQDSVQRMKAPQEWTVTKYDGLGRAIITGIYQHPGSTAGTNTRIAVQNLVNVATTNWETRTTTGNGYTAVSWPATLATTLSVNYYDSYVNIPGLPSAYDQQSEAAYSKMLKGLLTVTLTNVLNSMDMLWTAMYYDNDGRVIKTYKQHYYGGAANYSIYNFDTNTTEYNFNDQPTSTNRIHYIANAAKTSYLKKLTITDTYAYDHMRRPLTSTQQLAIGSQAAFDPVIISKNDYNELGQLKTKNLHATAAAPTVFKQSIPYLYNERGWLTKIGDPDNVSATSIFGMKLEYYEGANKQYNGNIGGISWQTKVPTVVSYQLKQFYTYTYDNVSRLTKAVYNDAGSGNAEKFNEELTYNGMGNITTLKRKNSAASNVFANNFTYNYTSGGTGNKLWSVTDAGTASQGSTYTYDGNGNTLTDMRNSISGIAYNMLNLPQTVSRTGGDITYTYDALGNKLRKVGPAGTREYINGIEYNGSAIDFIATSEGRARPNGTAAYIYEYYLKDHLGNTRATLMQDGSIVQVQDYYPFGLAMNPGNTYVPSTDNRYKYNGKELQDETGQYDYGARFYDPVIGRWTSVDPLAEKAYNLTPFRYGFNNPVRMIDPNGAYETDGHFWTVYLMATILGRKDALKIAFFTEAPDNIMSRRGDILSSPSTWLNPNDQFNVHALNGSPSWSTRINGASYVRQAMTYGELGESLHYLGDSYAHSAIGDEDWMYSTGIGHLFDGHDPDKIALRPGLYQDYVRNLADAMSSRFAYRGQVDLFTFNHVARLRGSTEQNSAILETEIRIREGARRFDVSGDFGGAILNYISESNRHYNRNIHAKTSTQTVTNYKKNSDGEWEENNTEQRTYITIQ